MLSSLIAPALLSWAAVTTPRSIASLHRSRIPQLAASSDGGVRLNLGTLSAGLTAAIAAAAEQEMKELAASGASADLRALELDEEAMEEHKARLMAELGDMETAGLVFQSDGAPTPTTLSVALVLTARHAAEVNVASIADLVAASESGAHPAHTARADLALATAVSETLGEMEASEMGGAQPESMEEARSMHMRWATLEMARARYAEDRPVDWGSADQGAAAARSTGASMMAKDDPDEEWKPPAVFSAQNAAPFAILILVGAAQALLPYRDSLPGWVQELIPIILGRQAAPSGYEPPGWFFWY